MDPSGLNGPNKVNRNVNKYYASTFKYYIDWFSNSLLADLEISDYSQPNYPIILKGSQWQ